MAQSSAGAPPAGSGAADPKKPAKPPTPTLESVGADVLSQYNGRVVKVSGIVGDYRTPDKQSYDFRTDDGKSVLVYGEWPEKAHVYYTLTARVSRSGGQYTLSEISKAEGKPGVGGSGPDPLLIAGAALIAAAVVTIVAMVVRSGRERQRLDYEAQLEEERRRTEAAHAEAEAARAQRGSRNGGAGSTAVVGDGTPPSSQAPAQPSLPPRPAHTIISVGSVQATGGPHAGQKFPLTAGENRIGRDKARGCGVLLDKDGEVSGYHGSIIVTMDGRMIYKDESSNGTLVNGKPVHYGQTDVHSGATIETGATTLTLILRTAAVPDGRDQEPVAAAQAAASAPATFAAVSASASPPASSSSTGRRAATVEVEAPAFRGPAVPTMVGYGAELEVISGPEAGQRFALTRASTTIGREDRDILLSDESVSRRHAVVTAGEGGFALADESSTHGTRVNGERVGPDGCSLQNGDRITLGRGGTVLLFHCLDGLGQDARG